jgi:hypothetical protein
MSGAVCSSDDGTDLDQAIRDHIAEDSLDQADWWVDRLDEKFRLLATPPWSAGRPLSNA